MLISRYAAINPPFLSRNGARVLENDVNDPSEFLKSSYRKLNLAYPKFFKMDNLCRLAFLSAEVLLQDTSLAELYPPERIGIILLNGSSSLETDEKHQESINDPGHYFPSPSVFVYTLPNIMTGEIAIRHRIKGENGVFISGTPDPKMIFTLVDELFMQNRVDCCIAGWVESYHNRLNSCLMLVEKEEKAKTVLKAQEIFIFEPSNIERLFKELT